MDDNPRHRRLRFGLRTLFELIAAAAFILALIYSRTPAVTDSGRYQFQIVTSGGDREQWVLDTQSGQVWRFEYGTWQESAPPLPTK